jgi:hypothetical protein
LSINRASATIVGVAAAGFAGATLTPGEDAWMPIRAYHRVTNDEANLTNRHPGVFARRERSAGKPCSRNADNRR